MGQTRQKGSLMKDTIPASVPAGPPGRVPGIIWVPKMAAEPKITLRIMKVAIMTYLDCLSMMLVFSLKFKCRFLVNFRIRVSRSMYSPKGHSQPQKNLPRTRDITITIPKRMPSFSRPEVE